MIHSDRLPFHKIAQLILLRALPLVWTMLLGVVLGTSAWAQDPDVAADPDARPAPKAKAKAPAKPAAAVPGEKAKPAPGKAKPDQEPAETPVDDPAVLAILETKPSTPADWSRVANILIQLNRPDLAKGFVQKILGARLNDEHLAALADQFGTGMYSDMASNPRMLPEAQQLSDAIVAATNKRLRDPKRLAALIQQIQDPSEEVQAKAMLGLCQARGAGVKALVDVLTDPARSGEHQVAQSALVHMRSEAFGPLVAIVERANPELAVQAIEVLAAMGNRDAMIYLLGPATSEKGPPKVRAAAQAALRKLVAAKPGRREATDLLMQKAQLCFRQRQVFKNESDGRVDLWRWDAAKKQAVAESVPVADASRALAARLAREAFALSPEDRQVRLLYLATMLDEVAYQRGLDKPLDLEGGPLGGELSRLTPQHIEELLDYAITAGHPAAAAAAAQVLGRVGTAREVLRQGADAATLVRAARHADPRVRIAALEAIVRLQPDAPFAGSSFVPDSLAFLTATTGVRKVLVAGPNRETSRELAGALGTMGYQVETATNGRETLQRLIASPDYEAVLIDAIVDHPALDRLVQQLRQDYRTAGLRIGVLAGVNSFELAQRVAGDHPPALAFYRPHLAADVRGDMKQLMALGAREFVGHQERQQQAARALDCLAALAGSSQRVYDLRHIQDSLSNAINLPGMTTRVIAVLAGLGAAESQQALVALAGRTSLPLEVRKAAVAGFRVNIQKYGILLTIPQIQRQYERYNQSEKEDPGTQKVLSLVLDCLEAPTQAGKGKE